MNENLKQLELLLAYHDWYYDYSDDYSQWCRGRDQRAAINAEVARVKALGLVAEADALVVKYAPKR